MPATPSDRTPAKRLALQALLDRSTRTAAPAVADSVAYPARQMSAAEFVEFWRSVRLVAMATVGPAGQPHIAPVHAELAGTMLRLRIYEDTRPSSGPRTTPPRRLHHLAADGAVAIRLAARTMSRQPAPSRPGQSGRSRASSRSRFTHANYACRAPARSSLPAQAWIRLSDPALVADLGDFFRAWGCISSEASGDTVQVLLPGAPTEPQAELQIRTCLGAWLATHPGVEAEIIA